MLVAVILLYLLKNSGKHDHWKIHTTCQSCGYPTGILGLKCPQCEQRKKENWK